MKVIRLGDHVVDVVTGFKGIAISRTEYLCDSPGVTVSGKSENSNSENREFSEDRLAAGSLKELQMIRGIIPMELKAVEYPEYQHIEDGTKKKPSRKPKEK